MTSNQNMSPSREQLIDEMMSLANQFNISTMLEQTLKQILQCKSTSPYTYLHKKNSLRTKFDNSKTSHYLCQLAVYLSSINPLILSQQIITSKIMSLCIDKFNHLKMKKFETNQFINFLLVDLSEKDKAEFIKEMNEEKMENDNLPVVIFANVMYWTVVYLWAVREVVQLGQKLKNCGGGSAQTSIGNQIFNEYLDKVDEEDSVLKMLNFGQLMEGENIFEKIVGRIFELFDGSSEKENSKNI